MNEPRGLATEWTVGTTLADFTVDTDGWGPGATRSTTLFADGAAVFSVGADGGEFYDDFVGTRNLAQYGNTVRMVFRHNAPMTGDWFILQRVYRGAGNSTGAEGTYAESSGTYRGGGETGETISDYTPPASTLDAAAKLAIYPGGGGRSGFNDLHLDRVEIGTGLTAARVWEDCSKTVLDALRADGERRTIGMPTYNYSSAANVAANHPNGPWSTDPNTRYIVHHYWDVDRSGIYATTYADAVAAAVSAGY